MFSFFIPSGTMEAGLQPCFAGLKSRLLMESAVLLLFGQFYPFHPLLWGEDVEKLCHEIGAMIEAAFPMSRAFGFLLLGSNFRCFFEGLFVEVISRHERGRVERTKPIGTMLPPLMMSLPFGFSCLTLCFDKGTNLLTLLRAQIKRAPHLAQETHPTLTVRTPHPSIMAITTLMHAFSPLSSLMHAVLATLSSCPITVTTRATGHQRCCQTQTGQCQYDYFCFHDMSFESFVFVSQLLGMMQV